MSPSCSTVRVSTREVRENSFRALRAAGASAGEAVAAADAVLEAETQGWGGLHALLREIDTLPAHVRVSGDADGVFVVDVLANRGPLLVGRGVFDLAAAQADRDEQVRVFARGFGFHRSLLFFALEHAQRSHVTAVLAEIDEIGTTTSALLCYSNGDVRIPDDPAELGHFNGAEIHGGLHVHDFSSAEHREWPVRSTPAERAERRAAALRDGLNVPDDVWASVQRASRRFLIPEPADTTRDQG